jgi:putative tryptophan/tyrosine transport system substrate-binding protein
VSGIRRRDFVIFLGGAAAAWPLTARAQQPALPVIGFLHGASPEGYAPMVDGFRRGLAESGCVEGQNVTIEYRWAEGHYERLPVLAAELVHRQVAGIVTGGTPPALAAKRVTSTIPIVINVGIDPVQFGLVASLNRPGGNVTGLAILTAELAAKRLELLHESLPTTTVVAMLVNPTTPLTEPETRGVRDAARSLGLQLHALNASTESEIDTAFGTLVELRAGALIVSVDPFLNNQRAQIVALAASTSVVKARWYRRCRLNGAQIICRRLAGPSISNNFERDLLSLIEAVHSRAFDRADMDEDVLAAIVRLNEAKAFLAIEPLHGSLRHETLPLGRV